ncbi:MAG TPA: hypothetical protein VFR86_04095, partial [Burkholderiaceae bacterium]|nr:hypothetical protein [Burkholderiaceae bacterium]
YVRFHSQSKALFYSDNATAETTYISRNRQLSTFRSLGLGVKGSYTYAQVEGKYTIKLHGAYERLRFTFSDFTDVRTGQAYEHDANVFQFFVTANY